MRNQRIVSTFATVPHAVTMRVLDVDRRAGRYIEQCLSLHVCINAVTTYATTKLARPPDPPPVVVAEAQATLLPKRRSGVDSTRLRCGVDTRRPTPSPRGPLGVRAEIRPLQPTASDGDLPSLFIGFDGGRTRARTLDPLIKSQLSISIACRQ
jgi:hypothetical protein